jgi:hypothetical protein
MAPLPKVGQPVIASRKLIPSISVSFNRRCNVVPGPEIASEIIAIAILKKNIRAAQQIILKLCRFSQVQPFFADEFKER